MSQIQDFVEINNQLPYKPIKSIKIINVTLQTSKINIQCKCQIQGGVDQTSTIVRTQDDLSWLIQTFINNNKTFLVPKIAYQNYLNLIYQKISSGQQAQRTQFQKKLKTKIIERALKLICSVILNHLKLLDKSYMYSIFIFFHKNFGLYKNPIYYKEQSSSLSKKVGNFFWQKYSIFSGNKKISWQQLQKSKQTLSIQLSKLTQTNQKLTEYLNNLLKLQQEYMRQKQIIKKRINVVQKVLLSYENQIKYIQLVIDQISETLARIQDKNSVQNMMRQYNIFVQSEIQKCKKDNKDLMKYYINVLCQNEQTIKIQAY